MKKRTVALLLLTTPLLVSAVELDGYRVKIGKRIKMGGPAVDVSVVAYEATVGDKKAIAVSGYLISHLPSRYYRITVTVTFWDVYPTKKELFERVVAKVTLQDVRPGVRTRWRALATHKGQKGALASFANPEPIHTISVAFVPYLPQATGAKTP